MLNIKPKRAPATYAIVAWMVINIVFMALELTIFNDAADPNNSILFNYGLFQPPACCSYGDTV
jgi:hypothetical protein